MSISNQEENLSIINEVVEIEGKVVGLEANLLIKGKVKGEINSKKITIAKEGKVFANIEAETVVIGGTFEGSIKASKLFKLLSEGSCSGSVICREIDIQEGGVINSEVKVVKTGDIIKKPQQKEEPKPISIPKPKELKKDKKN